MVPIKSFQLYATMPESVRQRMGAVVSIQSSGSADNCTVAARAKASVRAAFCSAPSESGSGRDEEGRTTACHDVEPLAIVLPWDGIGQSHAVGVHGEERIVLRHPKRERVDAHFAGALPMFAAGVVAGAL